MLRVTDPPLGHIALFRIVGASALREYDFLSQQARGHRMQFVNAKAIRLWDGISVYRTIEQARLLARRRPLLGSFIAELHVPMDSSFRMELDNGRDGHSTIWGDAQALLSLVVSVTPV